jgi:hypothetical protein
LAREAADELERLLAALTSHETKEG